MNVYETSVVFINNQSDLFLCVLSEAKNAKQPSLSITFVSMFVVNLDPEYNQNISDIQIFPPTTVL